MSRPKTMDLRIALSLPDNLVAGVDEWRRQESDIPNRSESIRRLIERGLTQEAWALLAGNLQMLIKPLVDSGRMTPEEIAAVDDVWEQFRRAIEAAGKSAQLELPLGDPDDVAAGLLGVTIEPESAAKEEDGLVRRMENHRQRSRQFEDDGRPSNAAPKRPSKKF